jgi:hypothetical protein
MENTDQDYETEATEAAVEVQPQATKPAPQERQQPHQQAPAPVVGEYFLEMPDGTSTVDLISDETQSALDGFSVAASSAGLPQAQAQALVEVFADVNAMLGAWVDSEGAGTPESCVSTLRAFWRGDEYDQKLAQVRATVKALRPAVTQWLEETELGNDPRAIIALSLFGDARLPKAQAEAELAKLMKDTKSDYYSSDAWRRQPAVLSAKALGRIVYADSGSSAPSAPAPVSSGPTKADANRAEALAMLADRNGPLMRATHEGHEAALARFHNLAGL